MKDTLKKIFKYLASAAFAILLLWVSFRDVEWSEFVTGVRACRWEYIALSMVAGSCAFLLRALRWRRLLLPIDPTISRVTTFNGVNIGNVSNFIFPRIGEFVRCGVITRRSKATYDKVLGTVIMERSWELLVMLMLLAVVVVFGFQRFGGFFVENILTPMSARFDFSIWWIVAACALIAAASLYILWYYRLRSSICAKVWNVLRGVLQGFSSCLRMDQKWLFFAYTAMIWGLYWLMAASTVWAAPFLEGLDMIDALFLSLVGGLGFAVPVPGGIGAFHFIISLALSTMYGVPVELGIVYATLSHTSQAITQIAFGAGSYIYESIRK